MKDSNTLKKSDVIAFFDQLAPSWITQPRHEDEQKLSTIFRHMDIKQGMCVLDIACGNGILTERYRAAGASHITGVDISSAMIARARQLHDSPDVEFFCADASIHTFDRLYDRCVIYNALPHFEDAKALCTHLHRFMADDARLVIAHSAGREHINARHHQGAGDVSTTLLPAKAVAAMLSTHFMINVIIDTEDLYLISGIKRNVGSNDMKQEELFMAQALLHENLQMQDCIKMSFQASFGAEHLLSDTEAAARYLHQEFEQTPVLDEALYEQIGQDVYRVNIGAWKKMNLPEVWLLRLFVMSAQNHAANIDRAAGEAAFLARLDIVSKLAKEEKLPFCAEDWETFKAEYLAGGIRAVHHSDIYRETNRPAYRVVSGPMCRMLPIFERIQTDEPFVIAIDGRCASGKTTLAENLCHVLDVDAVHMDDFFLPPALRTQDRLAEAGGNVHYERFEREVLPHLKQSAPFCYQRFDCSRMELGEMVQIGANSIRVVEGSYSHHEIFGNYADLRVACDIAPEVQIKRIVARDGEAYSQVFRDKWIPMEEQYFSAMQVYRKADLIL